MIESMDLKHQTELGSLRVWTTLLQSPCRASGASCVEWDAAACLLGIVFPCAWQSIPSRPPVTMASSSSTTFDLSQSSESLVQLEAPREKIVMASNSHNSGLQTALKL